ncbi:MAG: protease pro-enzyme activation domain-containing protein [Candidatus Sulfotelmatobacter sp.]
MRPWKFFLPLLASSLCFAAQPDRITGPINSSQTVALSGNVHRLAKPQFDQGLVEDSLPFGYVTLIIPPSASQQAALDQLLAQQQDRSSPNYHKWLTPAQYADRFGLSPADVNKITSWLESQGFQIVNVGTGRNSVVFSGTAVQIQNAFKTQIHRYRIDGREHVANSTSPSVPAALSGVVTGIRGLTNFRPKPMYERPAHASKNGPHPSYTTTVDGSADYFLAPGDVATLYDLNPLYSASPAIDGTGQKLAIIGQTDVYLADIANFRSGFGLSPISGCTTNTSGIVTACDATNFQYVVVGTDLGAPSTCGDIVEADLDIEWSGATARNAQIIYVNAPATFNADCTQYTNSGGVDAALTYAIDNTIAPVVSMSYGGCEAQSDLPAETLEPELQQGSIEGMTIMIAAGDEGAATCDGDPPNNEVNPPFSPAVGGLAVSYPASSPWVTAVGGTSLPFTEFSSTYWNSNNSSTTSFGASALSTVIGTEAAWNDDAEFAAFCQSNASNPFCANGGSSTGVAITSTQTAQQDLWVSAGGGGVSNCFNSSGSVCTSGLPLPTWQQNLTNLGLVTPQTTYRAVPDVSLIGSPNFPGYVFCTPVENLSSTSPYDSETTSSCGSGGAAGIQAAADGIFSGSNATVDPSIIGGTSVASPVFAGIVTLLNQYLGGSGLGLINPTLYSLAANNTTSGAFHPVKSGDNDVYCQINTPASNPADVICPSSGVIGFSASNSDPTTGYNLVGGLGSVDANALAVAWSASLDPDFQLAASPSSQTLPAGQSVAITLTLTAIIGSKGMVVNFSPSSCAGLPTGASCTFSQPSVTFDGTDPATITFTISTLADMTLPTGGQTITITPTNSPNTSATVSLTVDATNQAFTIAPTSGAGTYSIAAGGTEPINFTVTGSGSPTVFSPAALPLTYTCLQSSLPSETQCSFSPTNGQAVAQITLTLTITTTPPTSELRSPLGRGNGIFYALLLPGMFGILIAAGSRKSGARLLGLIVVLGFSTMWLGSCGGGGGSNSGQKNPGTPAGTYAIVVNATTGGATPLTGTFTVNLTVTQ